MRSYVLVILILTLAAAPMAQAETLQRINAQYFSELDDLAFHGYGDSDYWSKRSKFIAFRSGVHLTRSALLINADRNDGPRRNDKVKKILELNRAFLQRAHSFAFDGYGDSDYWSKRTKNFAFETAMHTANVAGLCDAQLQQAAGSHIARILEEAEAVAFQGYGGSSYWSRRCKEYAGRLGTLINDMNTALMQAALD